MNAADVAQQQVYAAWISAGAAVVQALGALAAIFVSIRLAQSSARREREANEAAAVRMDAADRAAAQRAADADRAAEERMRRAKNDSHNELIGRIAARMSLGIEESEKDIERTRVMVIKSAGSMMGGLDSEHFSDLRKSLPSLKEQTSDVELLAAIIDLEEALAVEVIFAANRQELVSEMEIKLNKIREARAPFEQLLR